MADLSLVVQFVANGFVIGSIIAVAAMGLTLAYGILNLSNFAYADFLSLGAFGAYLFAVTFGAELPTIAIVVALALALWVALDAFVLRRFGRVERLVLLGFGAALAVMGGFVRATRIHGDATSTPSVLLTATLLAVVLGVAVTLATEFFLWRPLRRRRATTLTLIIVSIGLALVLRNSLQLYFGSELHSFVLTTEIAPSVFGARVSYAQQFTLVAALVLIALVHVFLKYTRAGKAMRALADNLELARLSGIDVDRIIVYMWVIAGALTTVAGVLLALVTNNTFSVLTAPTLLLPLFAAVILGGIGSPYGAMIGGFLVGVAMKTSALWLGTRYEVAAAFGVLLVVILVRPQGLLGVKAR